jgi:nucleoside-diphosphate-sugar epimerase
VKVLVTGAAGFIGSTLVRRLAVHDRFQVRAAARSAPRDLSPAVEVVGCDLTENADWAAQLDGMDAVVHLAARVHMMRDTAADPSAEYQRVNVAGTLNLARQAAACGVRRFVFLSSIKVHGESGTYRESDVPAPQDAYGKSKHVAEVGLRSVAADTGLEITIIRPPLVYGPGVRANFAALIRAVRRGTPLPLGAVHNRRSLVAVDNLVDFIITCMEHPAAANETFLVSDGDDLSTSELVRRLARAIGRPAHLVPVPAGLLVLGATVVGKRAMVRRLLDSLQADITKARKQLAWVAPVSVDEALRRAVASRT